MILDPPAAALEYARGPADAFAKAGGVELARRAEVDAEVRRSEVEPLLEALGFREIDVRSGWTDAAAGAELCRLAGQVALPYPVVGVLSAPAGWDGALAVVDAAEPRINHPDLAGPWLASELGGSSWCATPVGERDSSRLAPFVAGVGRQPSSPRSPLAVSEQDLALALILSSWWLLGVVESVQRLTVEHVTSRIQFGHPLSAFQAVRFDVADMVVAICGLRELCHFTLPHALRNPERALLDALALRLTAVDVSAQAFRAGHQLHGAIGFCDEHDLSVLDRHGQAEIRLPFGYAANLDLISERIAGEGFQGNFSTKGDIL